MKKATMSKSGNQKKEDSNGLQLTTSIYTEFYLDHGKDNLPPKEQKVLKILYEKADCFNFGDLINGVGLKYSRIGIVDYSVFRRVKEDSESVKQELIYKVEKIGDKYGLVAGKYCGYIVLPYTYYNNPIQIKIDCGYSDRFFKRILDFCCGLYVNDSPIGGDKTDKSIYSLLVQYMFLISLRKTINNGLPKKYTVRRERGYDIKGNVDIESYINSDLSAFDKKITSVQSERVEIQPIVDVLYFALRCCNTENSILPNLRKYQNYLHGLYSGIKPSVKNIRKALSEPILKSSLYAQFKQPLTYADIIIKHNNIGVGSKSVQSSGFLVDASFLWETYLYNLLRMYFPDWNIDAQAQISVYGKEGVFYAKNNYPDIVMTKDDKIVILDAKFKRMTFNRDDVDMGDFRQIHFYAYYYSVKNPDKQIYSALVYPAKDFCKEKSCRFGGEYGKGTRFNVLTIEDPGDKGLNEKDSMLNSERKFINEIKELIDE